MANRPYLDQMEVDGVTYDLRAANGTPLIEGYGGNDLSEEFENAAALHAAIAAGDFSKIHIGDFFPITLNGTFHDAAADADKTINTNVKMEVAAINPYLRHGDTELTAQHILMCSRDCLPPTLQMRSENSTWFDTTQVNPWRGSAMWETLNNADNGIIKLLEATEIGPYVFKGPNNKGMRAMLTTMEAGAGGPSNWAWTDRGRLFLPAEREVYGAPAWGNAGGFEAGNLYNQWPIFAGSARHVIKGAGDGGSRSYWWLETANSAAYFAYVDGSGYASNAYAANTYIRVPLCFLLT